MKYVIEHLEPELFEWCVIEYKHISEIVGKDNLVICNVREKDVDKLKGLADVRVESVSDMELNNACVLDPEAPDTLKTQDKFEYLVFGGILGDDPPKQRTKDEVTIQAERRNLGKEQLATDNAVYVSKLIVEGKRFEDIKFQKGIEIDTAEGESVMFPFSYVLVEGKPLISKELIEYLKRVEG
ncbi:hypothetical protein KY328_05210 [Candidatus Woesearchaeota archaeon]|nr:hypothetical protein [Candidatus Woesearchaeota archaeon]MBW3022296.1 hypothetical protein [Candidatus Woesearchaeota archaeon]